MLSLNKVTRGQWVKSFAHLIVICMLFFLPELMMDYTKPHRSPYWTMVVYAKSAAFVAFFYLNYYVIINKTLLGKRRSYVAFVLANLALVVLFFGLSYMVNNLWLTNHPRHHHDLPRNVALIRGWSFVLRDVGMIVLTIALSAALRYAENWDILQKHNEQLVAAQREDELKSLKNQLNPHFLFNTLNTIYSLIEVDPREAQDAVHQLSKLLRYVLYESPSTVPLSTEIDFAKSYISLMKMRLGNEAVKADFSNVHDDVPIPPMILVTLIENAFKHGNTGQREHPIEITISSTPQDGVVCRTFNHFVVSKDTPSSADGGIGLANLRRRLLLIYGGRASLRTHIDGDTYLAVLTIK